MFMYSSRVYGFFNNIIVIIVFYRIYWEHVVYCTITDYKGKSEDFQCLFVDMTSASISINATIFHKAIKEEQEEYIIEGSSNNNLQQQICPTCKNKSISLIPLAKDEIYTIAMEGKCGLEIEFSKLRR
jgi:hypothetical protein